MAKFLTADDILSAPDHVVQKTLETVGGVINVRRITPAHREKIDNFYKSFQKDSEEKIIYRLFEYWCLIIEMTVVGEDGKTPIFQPGRVNKLADKDIEYYMDLQKVVSEENPIGTKKDIKQAKENLPETQPDVSDTN